MCTRLDQTLQNKHYLQSSSDVCFCDSTVYIRGFKPLVKQGPLASEREFLEAGLWKCYSHSDLIALLLKTS